MLFVFITVMSVLLWPCLQYHNLLKKIYMKFEPVFMKLDYSMKVKNKWRYEGGKYYCGSLLRNLSVIHIKDIFVFVEICCFVCDFKKNNALYVLSITVNLYSVCSRTVLNKAIVFKTDARTKRVYYY